MELKDFLTLIDPVEYEKRVKSLQAQQDNLYKALETYGKVTEIAIKHKETCAIHEQAKKDATLILESAEITAKQTKETAQAALEKAEMMRRKAAEDLTVAGQNRELTEQNLKFSEDLKKEVEIKRKALQEQSVEVSKMKQDLQEKLDKLRSVLQ